MNSSLTRDLNEYEEYRQFYEDQCQQLFLDEEAINLINKNAKKDNLISQEKKAAKESKIPSNNNNKIKEETKEINEGSMKINTKEISNTLIKVKDYIKARLKYQLEN